jgi:leucine dehydrogenase
MQAESFENLFFCQDSESGLKAIIAIHSTALGPALGGTRMWSYACDMDAVTDVLRLAKGMSYKAAVAGLDLGGGKGVIIGDPEKDKSRALFRAYGRHIERLGGLYITAEDVCTTPRDMDAIAEETDWVVGTSRKGGDPSPYTARGVLQGIKAAVQHLEGASSLQGKTVAVQGAGSVGEHLCRLLAAEGAELVVTDLQDNRCSPLCADLAAKHVEPEAIYETPCDIFAPCALGAVINDDTVRRLQCRIVAGGANNVLAEERHGRILEERGIVYVPDYVLNAGGLICVADQLHGFNPDRVLAKVEQIFATCLEVLQTAREGSIPTFEAADRIAEHRMLRGRSSASSLCSTALA